MQDAAADYRISIRSLLLRPDESRNVSSEIDTETAQSYGLPCQAPLTVEGVLENRASVLMFRYTLRCTLLLECDRCLSAVTRPVEEQFTHVIVTETASEQNDAEYLLAPDAMLDLAEVALTDLRLSLPTKTLCQPDCKGICPVCGQNRNAGECHCVSADITLDYQ